MSTSPIDLSAGLVNTPQSFATPHTNTSVSPGQRVQVGDATGTVVGQHPDTGKAIVQWDGQDGQAQSAAQPSAIDLSAGLITPQAQQPGLISSMPEVQALKGAAQGAVQTVAGVDNMVSKIPGVGKFLTTPLVGNTTSQQAIQNEHNFANAPKSTGADIGYGAEGLAEFLMGDAALKGLSLADKLTKIAPVLKAAEKYPIVANALNMAARQGTVAGTEALTKSGGNVGAGAAGGALLGGATEAIPEAVGAVKGAFSSKAAQDAADQAATEAENAAKTVQPVLQQKIRDVLADTAKEIGVKAPDPNASIRDAAHQVGDAALKKAQTEIYQKLDSISQGRWQRFSDQLKATTRELANDTGIDDDRTTTLEQRKADLEKSLQQVKDEAVQAGVNPDDIKKADALWKQGKALQKMGDQVRMSTTGRLTSAEANVDADLESVDPIGYYRRMSRLADKGTLKNAVGPQRADEILNHGAEAVNNTKTAKAAAQTAKDTAGELAARQKTVSNRKKYAVGGALAAVGASKVLRSAPVRESLGGLL